MMRKQKKHLINSGKTRQDQLVKERATDVATLIDHALPPGSVIPRHTEAGHFYQVDKGHGLYPSVTGILGQIKDPSIQLFQMNEALRYVEKNILTCIKDGDVDLIAVIDMLHNAKKAPRGVLKDAGDIGTKIHDRREEYFQDWIDCGQRPVIGDYIQGEDDPRMKSAMRGLNKFCDESEYIPIRTEVMVYSNRYQIAGMLDDIGMVNTVVREGDRKCKHRLVYTGMETRCFDCDLKRQWHVALCDLKSSNQFKDSYFFQVAMYHMMFEELTGVNIERDFILKVSKQYGTYSIEDLKTIRRLIGGAKKIIASTKAVDYVRGLRKKLNTKKTTTI